MFFMALLLQARTGVHDERRAVLPVPLKCAKTYIRRKLGGPVGEMDTANEVHIRQNELSDRRYEFRPSFWGTCRGAWRFCRITSDGPSSIVMGRCIPSRR